MVDHGRAPAVVAAAFRHRRVVRARNIVERDRTSRIPSKHLHVDGRLTITLLPLSNQYYRSRRVRSTTVAAAVNSRDATAVFEVTKCHCSFRSHELPLHFSGYMYIPPYEPQPGTEETKGCHNLTIQRYISPTRRLNPHVNAPESVGEQGDFCTGMS